MRALCVGECMVELRAIDDSTMRVGYAGDTYNTAVYLRRAAEHLNVDIDVGYLSRAIASQLVRRYSGRRTASTPPLAPIGTVGPLVASAIEYMRSQRPTLPVAALTGRQI